MKRVAIMVFVPLVFAMALLAGCGSSAKPAAVGPSSSVPPKITTVRLLTHSSFAVSKAVLAEFTKQTGYKVKLVEPGDAGVMVNAAILRKGDPVADAMFGVDNTFLTRALDAGVFDPYTAKGLDSVPAVLQVDAQHRVTPIDRSNVCVDFDKSWFGHDGRHTHTERDLGQLDSCAESDGHNSVGQLTSNRDQRRSKHQESH